MKDRPNSCRLLLIALAAPLLAAIGAGGVYWWKQQEEHRRVVEAEQRSVEVNAQARDYLENGEFAAGLSAADSILDIVEMPDLLETKFELLYNSGRRNEAYLVILKLLKHRPKEAHYRYVAGSLAFELNKPKEALTHFESAVKLEPQNTTYQIGRAKAYLASGDLELEKGRAILKKLVDQDPQCEDCRYHYASAYADYGDLGRAIEIFRQAADKFPDNHTSHFHLALALDAKGRQSKDKRALDEAVAHYWRSLELHPLRNSVAAKRIFEITGKGVPPKLEAITADEVPLEVEGNTAFVRARINGVEGRFVLDTGASYVAVDPNAAPRFKLTAAARVMEVQTANGVIQVPVAYCQLQLGKQKLSNAALWLMPNIQDDRKVGLFGMQFLQEFGAQIDVEHSRLVLNSDREDN